MYKMEINYENTTLVLKNVVLNRNNMKVIFGAWSSICEGGGSTTVAHKGQQQNESHNAKYKSHNAINKCHNSMNKCHNAISKSYNAKIKSHNAKNKINNA